MPSNTPWTCRLPLAMAFVLMVALAGCATADTLDMSWQDVAENRDHVEALMVRADLAEARADLAEARADALATQLLALADVALTTENMEDNMRDMVDEAIAASTYETRMINQANTIRNMQGIFDEVPDLETALNILEEEGHILEAQFTGE